MSEFDSLSDSDWLDISSNRESDTDSVVSDSDREDIGRVPLSRRSSISVGSSREGDIEAWEGFVSDSGDEESPNDHLRNTVTTLTADISKEVATPGDSDAQHDAAEDERVKEGLDQSLISTLSASRSSTASAHNSVRDLRLSFPDPLTRSRDEIERCYDDPCPSDTAFTSTDVPTDVGEVDEPTTEWQSFVDPGLHPTPEVEQVAETVVQQEPNRPEVQIISAEKAEFDVVLYGSSSSIKWSFAQTLVQKAFTISGCTVTGSTIYDDKNVMYIHLQRQIDRTLSICEFVAVYDRTDGAAEADLLLPQGSKRPSLAILYLPSMVYSLPEHTLYLPVLLPSASSTLGRITAQDDWHSLGIPCNKVVRLTQEVYPAVYDSQSIEDLPQLRAHRLLERLVSEGKKRVSTRSISEHLKPRTAHAVTLFALVSLVVGFALNTGNSYAPTPTATTAPSSTLWGIFGPEINRTAVAPTTARASAGLTSYHKDFSLSLFDPGSTSLAVTSNSRQSAVSVSGVEVTPITTITQAGMKDKTSEVMVRPTSQLSAIKPQPSMSMISPDRTAGPSGTKTTTTSLGSVVDSISVALDLHVRSLRHDLDDLVESLDELSRAVRRQTKATMQQSKGKAKEIRDTVQHRHERAKGRAKELRKRGEAAVAIAGEQLVGRTNLAKKKAREISKSLVTSDAWRVYQAAQVEWAALLKKGGAGDEEGGGEPDKVRVKNALPRNRNCWGGNKQKANILFSYHEFLAY